MTTSREFTPGFSRKATAEEDKLRKQTAHIADQIFVGSLQPNLRLSVGELQLADATASTPRAKL